MNEIFRSPRLRVINRRATGPALALGGDSGHREIERRELAYVRDNHIVPSPFVLFFSLYIPSGDLSRRKSEKKRFVSDDERIIPRKADIACLYEQKSRANRPHVGWIIP